MAAGNSIGRTAAMAALAALAAAPAICAPLPKPPAFAVCGVCHKVAAGEKPTIGQNLWAVGGRKAGTTAGFTYSPAMKASNITWSRDEIVLDSADRPSSADRTCWGESAEVSASTPSAA